MKKHVAVRIEEDFLKEIKIMLVSEGKSFQEYVMELINKDMGEYKNGNKGQ